MVSRWREILKRHWLKRPKVVPQETISGIQCFYICPDVSASIIRVFLISDFPAESVKANKNYQKISHILQTSANLTLKIICSRNTAKNISGFTNFPVYMLLFGVRKDICTQYFLTPKNCTLEVLWKERSVYFFMSLSLYFLISLYFFIKFLLQTRSKFFSGGGWDWRGGLSNFLKAASCLGFAHCFTIFCFDWNFWKFNYFSAFQCFYRPYSRPLLGATIAPNLVPRVFEKNIFIRNDQKRTHDPNV